MCKIDLKEFHIMLIYKMEQHAYIAEYIQSLTPKQKKAYEIAKDHLKDSFQIEKSNGFLQWHKKVISTSSSK